MEKTILEKFDKYLVTLWFFEEGDGEQRCCCDIENKATKASASLQLAQDMGFLERENGTEEKISKKMLDRIQKWADDNGY